MLGGARGGAYQRLEVVGQLGAPGVARVHRDEDAARVLEADEPPLELELLDVTEEGLACTNQLVQTVKDGRCKPFQFRAALNYYTNVMAKQLSSLGCTIVLRSTSMTRSCAGTAACASSGD